MKKVLLILSILFWLAETHLPGTVTTSGDQTVTSNSTTVSCSVTTNNGATYSVEWSRMLIGDPDITVGVIGSSTAVGISGTTTVDSSYVMLFRRYFQNYLQLADTVINLAVGGTDPRYGLPANWPGSHTGFPVTDTSKCVTALTRRHCDLIIVDYPTNAYDGLTIPNIMIYFQAIYDSAVASGAKCYVWGTQPRPGFDATTKAKLRVIDDSLRNRFGTHFLDRYYMLADPNNLLTYKREYAYSDSIHTTNIGHRRIYDIIRSSNIFRDFIVTSASFGTPTATSTTITNIPLGLTRYHVGVTDSWGYMWDTVLNINYTGVPPPPPVNLIKYYRTLRLKQ